MAFFKPGIMPEEILELMHWDAATIPPPPPAAAR